MGTSFLFYLQGDVIIMKVGDLVELSTYGYKLKMLRHLRDIVGVVTEVSEGGYPTGVFWVGLGPTTGDFGGLTRKDLRHVRSTPP
jgi:hypothetical protein